MDQALLEVDVVPLHCLEFAAAEACVEGGCPKRTVSARHGGDQCFGFGWWSNPVAAATHRGQADLEGRVDSDFAAGCGATVDGAQR
jgi:hypothetical protein